MSLRTESVGVYLTMCPLFVFNMKTNLMNVVKSPYLLFIYIARAHLLCGYQCYYISDPLVPIYVKYVGVICQLSLYVPSHIYYSV